MRKFVSAAAAACLTLVSQDTLLAQDPGQTGITMGYPGAVGVIWHATDSVAIRPEFQFSFGTAEASSDFSTGSETDNWALGTGVSALFYLGRWDDLRTYVSPRFAYTRTSSTFEAENSLFGGTSTGDSYSLSGLFGAQYSLGRKFAVFGEVGFGFTDTSSRSETSDTRVDALTWSTRTGLGAIFYF